MRPHPSLALAAAIPFLLIACASLNPPRPFDSEVATKEASFAATVSADSLNKMLRVSAPKELNTYKLSSPIAVVVQNVSHESLWLPLSKGPQVFTYSELNGNWTAVPDTPGYTGRDEILAPQGSGPASLTITSVMPQIPVSNAAVSIRIAVVGKVYRNGTVTDQSVGAYIDVSLSP